MQVKSGWISICNLHLHVFLSQSHEYQSERCRSLFSRLAMIGNGMEFVPALSFCLSFVFGIVFVIENSACVCNNGLEAVMK